MNITFDLDVVEPLNDFETDDSEMFQDEKLNQVITKIAYQSITQCCLLFLCSLHGYGDYKTNKKAARKKHYIS